MIHTTNVIHSLMVVTVGAATRSTLHMSPCAWWKEIPLEGLTLGGSVVVYSTMKICNKCKETKPLTEYYKRSASKDGLFYQCKTCKGKTAAKWQQTDKYKKYKAKYDNENKVAKADYDKQYYEANKEAIIKSTIQYAKERRDTDPLYRLTGNIRCSIRQSLINGGYSKTSQTHKILGCSYEEYYQHIESQFTEGMSWDVMSEIHIDHRLPVSAATTEAELLALNHHRNLQPLWKSDNMAKGSSYCPKELAAYFKKHL